jgi:hypothetical protein
MIPPQSSRSAATLVALLCACGPGKGGSTDTTDTTDTTSASTSSPTTTTTTTPPTTTAPTTSSGTDGASEATTAVNGLCIDGSDEPDGVCAGLSDRARCNAAQVDPAVGGCLWIPWFPVRLVDGVCTFGDPRGTCEFIPCSEEGCATLSPCNSEGFGGAFLIDGEGKVTLGFADWCLAPPAPAQACIFDGQGQLLEGPPECACLCDPTFPGA